MLIDKYLAAYHFKENHSIEVNSPANDVYQKMLQCDFSHSSLIRFLFRLRGMPKNIYTIEQLTHAGFIKLDESKGSEIVYGMLTNSPMFNSCQSDMSPIDFIGRLETDIIKAVINFEVKQIDGSKHSVSTETRVWCGSRMKAKFKFYWFFVKPFSRLIRQSILRQMKKQIQSATTQTARI